MTRLVMSQLRQLALGGLALLALSAPPALRAATSDCFVPARDGSGIGDLHLLSSDPLETGALAELKVSRASAFFRDTDLAGITADMIEGGDETQLWFTFTSKADYEILINRTAHVGNTTTSPKTRAYLIRYRYCVRNGQLLVAARPNPLELEAARTALRVLRALLASNKMLPEIQVAEVGAPEAASAPSG